ncbi:MAG: TolC family outer membrane protein [Bermanella sp.]
MKKLALAFITLAVAATSQATDLKSVFEQAVSNDPQLAAELASARANAQTQGTAGNAILPTITLNAEVSETTTKNSVTRLPDDSLQDIDGTFNKTSYDITLVQPLFSPSTWYSYAAASATTDSSVFELRKAEQSMVVRAAEAYFDVLRANATLASAKATETAVKRQLEQTQQRFKVGLIAITDVHEAQSIYDNATVGLIEAETQLDIAYESLAVLTGTRYDRINPLKDEIPLLGPMPADRSLWEKKALAQNLDVLIAEKSGLSAKQNHNSKKSEHLPSVNLVGVHTISDNDASNQGEELTSTYLGVQLSMPLYAGGSTWAGQKQAYYQRQAAEQQLELTQRQASLSVRSLYRQLEADVARIKARNQAMTSARSAMEATQTGYEVGTRNIVEVLDAQTSVFSAQQNYAYARFDYVIDLLKFRQSVGELSTADIDEVNSWLLKK